jgi:hypothetical protein
MRSWLKCACSAEFTAHLSTLGNQVPRWSHQFLAIIVLTEKVILKFFPFRRFTAHRLARILAFVKTFRTVVTQTFRPLG